MRRRTIYTACVTLGVAACAAEAGLDGLDDVPAGADAGPPAKGDASDASPDAKGGLDAAPVDCRLEDFCVVPGVVEPGVTLNAVWGSGEEDLFTVGTRGTVLHRSPSGFETIAAGSTDVYFSVWGRSPSEVWLLAGTPRRLVRTQNTWSIEEVIGPSYNADATNPRLWAIGGTARDTWMVGFPTNAFEATTASTWRFESADAGAAWRPVVGCSVEEPCTPPLLGLQMYDEKSAWAVGVYGGTLRLSAVDGGAAWQPYDARTGSDLEGVWGTSADAAWAVGGGGTIRRFEGAAWTPTESPTARALHAVWGSKSNDVWAVGDGGTVLHFDGSTWKAGAISVLNAPNLYGVWGSGEGNVWIVGDGVVLHRTAENRRDP